MEGKATKKITVQKGFNRLYGIYSFYHKGKEEEETYIKNIDLGNPLFSSFSTAERKKQPPK